ncbi:hypothetical protein A2331_03455 [Candidatus Falkowbacteria bacterium RIFOXYB2_FULL_34_18]|uniref:Sulfatase-modifying factor enzyme-like domain-containing protein n=1 Tax=Candidatus Falkowbacteria bacterium RIFOXYD2_FULL_34_120 TaxID=1798007 RepID=A0A1F5TS50_9BACT|nr:MAG: hypothetical protein A2331_03455 [Candidatus Falkowbacteria bacterium RIFOXYB2_FULL_34_18]OGF30121.1 MAG: hypothetical protein A2500_04995 [Candidatus Falkowbacteria bacterium RIFOXYC12_FULL_34_55]OGF37545.1 MAG: hypothetical protein A2466_01850 [Candidatus Falkowbacteria bacterium RIFOXYC2_FULL_34_220]OGF39301.1 MAG: hypothetical protein A2515_02265 [Candidatus Falkowbacteria bacterium RIFOXYD12_FULL_34_57]OGF41806.1 MAG: hypothetical protein A2531_05250 [Candidatus Falkowbacteria bact
MRRFVFKILKGFFIGIIAVIFVTIGIDAADHYDNFSESMVGRIVLGEKEGPCPAGMVFIPTENKGFCIDQYEASANDNCLYTNPSGQENSRNNIDQPDCFPVSKKNAMPWRFISQSQAITACAKAGKRLPTDEEWYLASLGTPDLSKDWKEQDCQVSKNWQYQPGPTGSGASCISSFGAYDMIGNVWEWVKGEIKDGKLNNTEMPRAGYISAVDIKGNPIETNINMVDFNFNHDYLWMKIDGVRGMARGGYWDNKEEAGIYSMYLVSPPTFAGTGVGFRCAK